LTASAASDISAALALPDALSGAGADANAGTAWLENAAKHKSDMNNPTLIRKSSLKIQCWESKFSV
jgi:hypothetical protein